MYVSPAVRSIRDHPETGESVQLHVRFEFSDGEGPEVEGPDADGHDDLAEGVAAATAAAGGTVGDSLQFGGRVVRVDQDRVGDLLDGLRARDLPIEAVETTAVTSPGDAGEDVGDPDAD